MALIKPPYWRNGLNGVHLDVPESKIQRYLDQGWTLVDGETFTPEPVPTEDEDGNTILADGRVIKPGEDDTVGDTADEESLPVQADGATLAYTEPVKTGSNGQLSVGSNVTGSSNLPTLGGKTRDDLIGIARSEHIEVDQSASKPAIRTAIEDAREARNQTPHEAEPDEDDE